MPLDTEKQRLCALWHWQEGEMGGDGTGDLKHGGVLSKPFVGNSCLGTTPRPSPCHSVAQWAIIRHRPFSPPRGAHLGFGHDGVEQLI